MHNDGEYYNLASVDHNVVGHRVEVVGHRIDVVGHRVDVVGILVAGSHDELERVQEQVLETEQNDHLQR